MSNAAVLDPSLRPWPREAKAGWIGSELSKEALAYDLGRPHLLALRELVSKVVRAGTPLTEIGREDFRHPALDPLMYEMVSDLKLGPGLTFLRGVDVADYTTDELRVLFVGLGSYFGRPVSQSKYGDLLGEVTPVVGRENDKRGYVVDRALRYHVDHAEVFGLFCIVDAAAGGDNLFLSSLKLHELLRQERPEYLSILERGWRIWLVDEQPLDTPAISPHRVPVFATVDGVLSAIGAMRLVEKVTAALGETLSHEEAAAIQYALELRDRPELAFQATLAPGETVFVNNFEILHARTAVTHHADRKRHLLRLWLEGAEGAKRPLPPEYPIYRFMNKSGRQGIDALPKPELDQQIEQCNNDPISKFMREVPL